jgi:hypothetical protein
LRDLSEDQFLEHLRRSNDPARRYIVNFDRAQIFGAGVGHHSPIGGDLAAEDLAFVLRTGRCKAVSGGELTVSSTAEESRLTFTLCLSIKANVANEGP